MNRSDPIPETIPEPGEEEKTLSQPCPSAGTGVHPWIHLMICRHFGQFGEDKLRELLAAELDRCGREIEPHEINDSMAKAHTYHAGVRGVVPLGTFPENRTYSHSPVPKFSPEKARAKALSLKKKITRDWLKKRSTVSTDTGPDQALRLIYPEPEKLVIFHRRRSQGFLWPKHQISDMVGYGEGLWFLSNPVDGSQKKNSSGKMSQRSGKNVTSFRFGVLESDHWKEEEEIWLALLVQMVLPIVMITHSGDRGAHALVRLDAKNKADWDHLKCKWLEPQVEVGADHDVMTAVRLTRVPNVWREETKQKQELLYLNPGAKKGTMIYG